MPDNIPQKTWKKAHEFLDALANGTTDLQQLAAKDAQIAAQIAALQAKCEALAQAEAERDAAYERAAVVAANFKHADPVDDKRDDGSGSFGLGVDVASDSIAAAIRQLKGQHHD